MTLNDKDIVYDISTTYAKSKTQFYKAAEMEIKCRSSCRRVKLKSNIKVTINSKMINSYQYAYTTKATITIKITRAIFIKTLKQSYCTICAQTGTKKRKERQKITSRKSHQF
jgi:hypothetical protein